MDTAAAAPARVAMTHAEIRTVIVGLMLSLFLAALDQTIIATALPTIGQDLGDLEHLPWVVTSYLLAATAVTPLYGKVSDTFGRRGIMLFAIGVFIAGSVACALSPNMLALVLARGLQGLGGGGLIALSQTIVGDMVSPRERGRYQVYFGSTFMLASLAGPVLGGFFAQHLHWTVIFWINIPLGAVALVIAWRGLRKLPQNHRRRSIDVQGALLMVAATVSAMLALSWGGIRYSWGSPPILGLFACSLALWVLFAWRMSSAREPLIPPGVLRNPVVRMATLAACFGMGTFTGLIIYLPVYFEAVRGLSASESGFALIPCALGTAVGATFSGRSMVHVTHYKRLPMLGILAAVIAAALLAAFAESASLLWIEALLVMMSIGLGTMFPVCTVSVQNAVPLHELGTATATMNFFRSLGGAMIVAGFGAIVLGFTSVTGAASFEAIGHAAAAGGADITTAFRWVMIAACAGFAVSYGFFLAMEEKPLRANAAKAAEAAIAD
jgi:EmrB/QacA subfamily drug resistance transporter